MTTTVHHYPGCSTCKKAIAWLKSKGVAFLTSDLVASPPSSAELERLWKASGRPLSSFFNTSGQSYRSGNFKDRLPSLSEQEQLDALAADGKLIKRPLLVVSQGKTLRVAVGFREELWEELLEV